jgi:cytochrome b pre-mRNA-processing protein 3
MLSALKNLVSPPRLPEADGAYIALVAQARNAFFYETLGVPDSIDGRFEMIVLHLFLIQHRLLANNQAREFAHQLGEAFIDDMDRSIREFGVADTGVAKRIKRMGRAYNGRLQVYSDALNDADQLRAALSRNLYGTVAQGDVAQLSGMADYVQRMVAQLATVPSATIIGGAYTWPMPDAARR